MIHLSRFLIGIRHTRTFRMQNESGRIMDDLIKLFPKEFTGVKVAQGNTEVVLSDADNALTARINIDDIIIEGRKLYDIEKKSYSEINKLKIINTAKGCLPSVSKRLELDKDYQRVGMIFEFRIPEFIGIQNGAFGKFIYDNFITFHQEGEGSEASLRFVYKVPIRKGMIVSDLKDFRNVIVMMHQARGIDEDGKEKNCLLVSVDIQRLLDPALKTVDVDEHYSFATDHLQKVILPAFKAKGVDINL